MKRREKKTSKIRKKETKRSGSFIRFFFNWRSHIKTPLNDDNFYRIYRITIIYFAIIIIIWEVAYLGYYKGKLYNTTTKLLIANNKK